MRRLLLITLLALPACRFEHAASGRPPGDSTAEVDSLARVEQDSALTAGVQAALRLHYQRYAARDWRAFRRTFWPGATIGLRGTPAGERRERVWIQTVEEFVRHQDGPARASIIGERVVHTHVTGYGDVADAWVITERRVAVRQDSVRMVRGIDAFHLLREGTEWRIVSLMATPENSMQRLVPPTRRPARRGPAATSRPGATRSGP